MARRLDRRVFLAAGAAAAGFGFAPAIAQAAPFKIGLLTVKTGPLAQGGIQMEQGHRRFPQGNATTSWPGARWSSSSADTGGNPAGAKTKAQELIERDKVDMIFGPLAAFELLAITDYVAAHKTPILSLAAAEDMTQRKPNPYLVRAVRHARRRACTRWRDYARKELKYKRRDRPSPRTSPSATSRWAASSACSRTTAARSSKKLWPPLGDAGLHALHRPAHRRRLRRAGFRRIEPVQVHEAAITTSA